MFQKQTIKALTTISLILNALFLVYNIIGAGSILAAPLRISFGFYLSIVSAAILLWASIIAVRLSAYKVNEELYKKIGIRAYAIPLALLLTIFVDLRLGVLASIAALAVLFILKRNLDEWYNNQSELFLDIEADDYK
jgi:hypothetical protein